MTGVLVKNGRLDRYAEERPLKTQGEEGYLQARERGPRRNQPCPHLVNRLLASRIVRK